MDEFLSGKNAVVTGGTRGIGRAITEALLRAGAGVVICARNAAGVEQAVDELRQTQGGRVTGCAADVSERAQVHALFEHADRELGRVDILVNNAGIGSFGSVAEFAEQEWHKLIGTNLTGVFHCCQEALARFRRGGGYIINISSLAGKNPFAGGAAYNASKFGLNGFSEALMLDHRYDNVKVTTILPGSVATEFTSRTAGQGNDWKVAAEDIADIVLFLLRLPPRTLVSSLDVRPSRPPRRG